MSNVVHFWQPADDPELGLRTVCCDRPVGEIPREDGLCSDPARRTCGRARLHPSARRALLRRWKETFR